MLLFNGSDGIDDTKGIMISKHFMLLFNPINDDNNITRSLFQNISCYCLTNEKSLFLNRFFTKKNDFITFFNVFTNRPFNFSLFRKTTYSSRFYYFFKKSLGKILNTSFISSFLTLPIMNPINQICNPNIQIHI